VDRFDTWLNAQQGRRRLALIAVTGYVPTVMVGFYSWLCLAPWAGGTFRGPTLSAFAVCAILAVPAAVGLSAVGAMLYARQARNPRGKQAVPPFLMWRMIAAFWLMLASSLSATFVADQGSSTASHRVLAGLQLIFAVAVIGLFVETLRYRRRFARARIE
jgi:hypothetical protein